MALRPALCAVAGVVSITRISLLWMHARDKRMAIEETVYWLVGILLFFMGIEIIEELIQRWHY